jgi:outer membrane PBP1 activator LpoA protein
MTGHPVEGTRALVERERWLNNDPASLRTNRAELYSRIREAAERGQSLKPPPKSDPIVVGWLELGPVAVGLARDPVRAAPALANWKRQFPQHPANDSVLASASTQIAAATEFPDQIALLLPLSGRSEAVGVAVRDGFISAYLEQPPASRPRLKIYDVAAESVGSAYAHAVSEGAAFVVGPLTKEDVSAVLPLSGGHLPVLALNFLNESVNTPHNFYQFALSPEDEARSVAKRAWSSRPSAIWAIASRPRSPTSSRSSAGPCSTVSAMNHPRSTSPTPSNRFCRCTSSRANPRRIAPMPPSCSWWAPPASRARYCRS